MPTGSKRRKIIHVNHVNNDIHLKQEFVEFLWLWKVIAPNADYTLPLAY